MSRTLQFCRATGRRLKAYFARVAKRLKPNGSFKFSVELAFPPFLKTTIEYTPKGHRRR